MLDSLNVGLIEATFFLALSDTACLTIVKAMVESTPSLPPTIDNCIVLAPLL